MEKVSNQDSNVSSAHDKKFLTYKVLVIGILLTLTVGASYLFYQNTLLKKQLAQVQSNTTKQSEVNPTSVPKIENYSHQLDEIVGFSLNYPVDSKIEEILSDDKREFTLIIKPSAPYYTATTTFELKVFKQLANKDVEFYQPSRYVSEQQSKKDQPLVSGILPIYIDRLPTYEYYSVTCPELGSVCEKKDIYYINPLGYFFTVTTSHFTDTDGNQMRNKVLDDIVASIKFSQNKQ